MHSVFKPQECLPFCKAMEDWVLTRETGKTIKSINISGSGKGTLQVDASTLASGAYSYYLYVDGKMLDSKTMILAK